LAETPEPERRALRGCDAETADGWRCPHALTTPRHQLAVGAWAHWRTFHRFPCGEPELAPRWLVEAVQVCEARARTHEASTPPSPPR
jgi:hypothetical protein